MQITRQADYAVRTILYLAISPLANVKEIAKAQSIPYDYLAKTMKHLVNAGLVKTHRGVQGGISLTRPPEQITLLEVIEAVDGPLALNLCLLESNNCPRDSFCAVHEELEKIQRYVAARMEKLNFAVLARKEKAKRRAQKKTTV